MESSPFAGERKLYFWKIKLLKDSYKSTGDPDTRSALSLYTDEEIPFVAPIEKKKKAKVAKRGLESQDKPSKSLAKKGKVGQRYAAKRTPLQAQNNSSLKVQNVVNIPFQTPELLVNLSQDEDLSVENDVPSGSASNTASFLSSSMSKFVILFSNPMHFVGDKSIEGAYACLARIGQSSILGQTPESHGTSRSLTPDFLSSFISLASKTANVVASDLESRYNSILRKYNQLKLHSQDLEKKSKRLEGKNKEQEEKIACFETEVVASQKLGNELSELRKENANMKRDYESAKDKASRFEEKNRQLYTSEKKVQELEVENQRLAKELSHRTERCNLYKKELSIEQGNQYKNLERYRNSIYEKVCETYGIPKSNFPDLEKLVEEDTPSLNVKDSDLEDSSSEEELESDENEDREPINNSGEEKQ